MSDQGLPNDEQIRNLRAKIAETPEDLKLRFELGLALFHRGDFRASISEFQKAQHDPTLRLDSFRRLADSFDALGMHDLAASRRRMLGG